MWRETGLAAAARGGEATAADGPADLPVVGGLPAATAPPQPPGIQSQLLAAPCHRSPQPGLPATQKEGVALQVVGRVASCAKGGWRQTVYSTQGAPVWVESQRV